MKKVFICTAAYMIGTTNLYSRNVQDSIPKNEDKGLTKISAFLDVFYVYDFNKPPTEYRQTFLYNYNRNNEVNLNLGVIKISTSNQKYKASFALQSGTYCNDNYANEPGLIKNINEANISLALNRRNNLWICSGIFSSHIGFESAFSSENFTLTRSILAENSPYYLAGTSLSYSPNSKLDLQFVICNGWQRIRKVQGNSLPSFGSQAKLYLNDKTILNWSTFVGSEFPDSSRKMRIFNNFYSQFETKNKVKMIFGFDIGIEQKDKGSHEYNSWLSPVVITQIPIKKKWRSAFRIEYFLDKYGTIISTNTKNGFQTWGCSLNMDYLPSENILCRIEGRLLNSIDPIFYASNNSVNNNFIIATSIAIKFPEK